MPGWLTDHFQFFDFQALWLGVERQSARKPKSKNDRLASLALNPLVTVPILELWTEWVKFNYLNLKV